MRSTPTDQETSIRAVYDHSATQFVRAVGTTLSPRFEAALDRAVLDVFADDLTSRGNGPVLDVGCGPGRVAGHLAARGLDARGVDISTRMVEAARVAHPALQFDRGSLTDLPVPDSSVAAAVYWYSIIATSPAGLAAVWTELGRVLRDGGQVLIAFQAGDGESSTIHDAYGSSQPLTLYRHSMDHVAATLQIAGFVVDAKILRGPQLPHETGPQAFLTAR